MHWAERRLNQNYVVWSLPPDKRHLYLNYLCAVTNHQRKDNLFVTMLNSCPLDRSWWVNRTQWYQFDGGALVIGKTRVASEGGSWTIRVWETQKHGIIWWRVDSREQTGRIRNSCAGLKGSQLFALPGNAGKVCSFIHRNTTTTMCSGCMISKDEFCHALLS